MRSERRHWFWVVYPETDADQNRTHCGGGLDVGLTPSAIEEAQKFAKRFKRSNLKIKRIVAGAELRTIQMADVVHDEMKGKILLSGDFRDQILGELEGKPVAKGEDVHAVAAAPPRGETGDAFRARVKQGLEKLAHDNIETLLVLHPRVARVVMEIYGLPGDRIPRLAMMQLTLPTEQAPASNREL